MISGRYKRNARIAAAVMFLALVASPMGVAAGQFEPHAGPELDRPMAIDLQARVATLPSRVRAIEAAERVLHAEKLALADAARIDHELIIELSEMRAAKIDRLVERAELRIAEIAALPEAMAWDRDIEVLAVHDLAFDGRHLDCESPPPGMVGSAIDMLVSASHLPARAGLVVRHLVGAVAKITPRVARAFL